MADVQECLDALHTLAARLQGVDPEVRRRRIPNRVVSVETSDLGVGFTARLDQDGLRDITTTDVATARLARVRFVATSDVVVAVARDPKRFAAAWLRRRLKVHASVADILELRRAI